MGIGLCLCLIVAANTYNRGLPSYDVFGKGFNLMPGFCGLDVLVIAAIALPVLRYLKGGRHATSASQQLGLVVLTIGLACAVVMFFFAVCNVLP